jgi:hypothetical protein
MLILPLTFIYKEEYEQAALLQPTPKKEPGLG